MRNRTSTRSAGVPREALGPHALATVRFDAEGRERPEFVLNQPRYRGAGILLATLGLVTLLAKTWIEHAAQARRAG